MKHDTVSSLIKSEYKSFRYEFKTVNNRNEMKLKSVTTTFVQNFFALFIMGLLYALALSLNNLFVDIRETYLKGNLTQIVSDIVYFLFLSGLLAMFVFFYKGTFNIQDYVLK